ncbi:hypothetical protein BDF21DRAFT_396916 [Thamnidium elegans]|nr:hypothetical protein BDF21DRAFT_396916 [Thamnidium elegans]
MTAIFFCFDLFKRCYDGEYVYLPRLIVFFDSVSPARVFQKIRANIQNLAIRVRPAKRFSGDDVIYSQQTVLSSSTVPPPAAPTPSPAVPSSECKRKQEDFFLLLQQDICNKRARLEELKGELQKMEKQEALMKQILDLA